MTYKNNQMVKIILVAGFLALGMFNSLANAKCTSSSALKKPAKALGLEICNPPNTICVNDKCKVLIPCPSVNWC